MLNHQVGSSIRFLSGEISFRAASRNAEDDPGECPMVPIISPGKTAKSSVEASLQILRSCSHLSGEASWRVHRLRRRVLFLIAVGFQRPLAKTSSFSVKATHCRPLCRALAINASVVALPSESVECRPITPRAGLVQR